MSSYETLLGELESAIAPLPASIIPNVTAGHADDSEDYRALYTRIHDLLYLLRPSVFDVRRYGAQGDGVTDDSAAVRAAYAAAVEAIDSGEIPGATIYFPRGRYLLDDYEEASDGLQWILMIRHDHITIAGDGPSTIITSNAEADVLFMFFAYGGFRDMETVDGASFYDHRYPFQSFTSMTAAEKGDEEVVVADASGISVGDWVYVRTGDVSDASRLVNALLVLPDSEINQVVGKSGTTLQLRWPLSKPYAQEKYLDSSDTGMTSIEGENGNAPLGVAKITAKTIHDLTFRDLTFDTPNAVGCISAEQVVGLTMQGIGGSYGWTGISAQAVRNVRMVDWVLNKAATPSDGGYPVAVAYCSNDCEIGQGIASGLYPPMLHCHEGVAGLNMHDIICKSRTSPNTPDYFTGLSIRGRNYDSTFSQIHLAGGSTGDFLAKVGAECTDGGLITGCRFVKSAYTASMGIAGKGWRIADNYVDKPIVNVDHSNLVTGNYGPGAPFADGYTGFDAPHLLNADEMYLGGDDFTAPGTTPSVIPPIGMAGKVQFVGPSAPVSITDLVDAANYEDVYLHFLNGNTTLVDANNGGSFGLAGGVNWTPTMNSTIHLYNFSGVWYELGRTER